MKLTCLNINLEYLEDLTPKQRREVLGSLVDYWLEKDGWLKNGE